MVRLLRPVSDPLGSYLRVGRQDHTFLAQMPVDGKSVGSGLIADPAQFDKHKDLWIEAHQHDVETVLDPQLKKPLVGEHTGAVGVGLMAFGALGGVESGITVLGHTDLADWLHVPTRKRGGGNEARIYLPELGAFLDRSKAESLLKLSGMEAAHACRDTSCCPRGWKDTQVHYREHFVTQRSREVSAISNVPEPLSAGSYLENFLRPATDKAIRAADAEPSLMSTRKRLESWRGTFGNDLTTNPVHSFSPPAAGKLHRKTA